MRPKVLFIGPVPPPANGMTVLTEALLRSEVTRRVHLIHLDTSDHRPIGNIGRFETRNVLLALWHGVRFVHLLATERPDVVHVQVARDRLGFLRDALFLIPARVARRTVVVHLHSRDFDRFYGSESRWMRLLIRTALNGRVFAVVLSERFRKTFEPIVPAERTFVVPNGIDDVGSGIPAAGRRPVVLHLSTLWSEKGVFDVVEVARRVRSEIPDVRFVLAGGWFREHERDRALAVLAAESLEDIVELPGPVAGEAKQRLLRDAALLLFPTRYPIEGQPVVVLEALAAGTPVVATELAAIPDMIQSGSEGYLTAPGDVDGLTSLVATVLTDAELRGRLGAAARRRYEAEYTTERFAARLVDVWNTVAPPVTQGSLERGPAKA